MKYDNMTFGTFWRSLPTSERASIAVKADKSLKHIEQVAGGQREMHSATAFGLIEADNRITMRMCFPERFK